MKKIKQTKKKDDGLIVYRTKSGAIELRGDFEHETIWATQNQMSEVFDVERSVVTKHIRNILRDKELNENSVCAKFAHTAEDGKTYQVQCYSLDVLLSVGYRANSARATEFRQWATKTLREHITKGYTMNRNRIGKNYDAFLKSVADIQALLPEHVMLDPKNVLDLIKEFASTWVSLDAYDKESLTVKGTSKKSIKFDAVQLLVAIADLKRELIKNKEATELFATERAAGNIEGIIGNVMQSFGGKALYPTLEETLHHRHQDRDASFARR